MELIDIKKQIIANGTNLNRLAQELVKPQVCKMSHLARCKHINLMKLTYGEVRFTCPEILYQHLGITVGDIITRENQTRLWDKSNDIYVKGTFHISRVKYVGGKGYITVFGFLIDGKNPDMFGTAMKYHTGRLLTIP